MNFREYAENYYSEDLTQIELRAIKEYTTYTYKHLNENLRTKQNHFQFQLEIRDLDSAICKFKFREDITVYRDLIFYDYKKLDEYVYRLTKNHFTENGYMSSSLKPGYFNENFNIRMEINVPAFCRGAYIRFISSVPMEDEYLIGRGVVLEPQNIKRLGWNKYLVKANVVYQI